MENLRDLFESEKQNMIGFIVSAKKKEREDFYEGLLHQLRHLEPAKVAEVLSNYMDACRNIQREEQDELRE